MYSQCGNFICSLASSFYWFNELAVHNWSHGLHWFLFDDTQSKIEVKAVANEDTMLRTHCCGHKCFPVCPRTQHLLWTQNLCPRHKNVSDFFQKHFLSATNVSRFAQHRNNNEQQCVRNIVSSFATTFSPLFFLIYFFLFIGCTVIITYIIEKTLIQ